MEPNSEQIAEAGYDEIAVRYLDWMNQIDDDPRLRFLNDVMARLPDRPTSLDLGCGAGVPCTALLAERGEATGVDVSAAQLELAHRNVPKARFVKAGMGTVTFPPASFDLVTAFYSIQHLPRTQHAGLFQRIAGWLRPGGHVLTTLATRDIHNVDVFLGAPMLTSSYTPAVNRRLLLDAGLTVLTDEVVTWYQGQVSFQWLIASKPVA